MTGRGSGLMGRSLIVAELFSHPIPPIATTGPLEVGESALGVHRRGEPDGVEGRDGEHVILLVHDQPSDDLHLARGAPEMLPCAQVSLVFRKKRLQNFVVVLQRSATRW